VKRPLLVRESRNYQTIGQGDRRAQPKDARHLLWLREELGQRLVEPGAAP
jgi:hypothetical protein